jgi:hypothetical protein
LFEKTYDGPLIVAKSHELYAGSDDPIRTRFGISHLTADRHVNRATELNEHSEALTHKLPWTGEGQIYPQTELREIEDRALPPSLPLLALDLATSHP